MSDKPLLRAYAGQPLSVPPVWLMRQAGRYLPEYRALRADAGGFLDMVYHPQRACEITMQPIRRFGMDGAILFSDILVVPHALGQDVTFIESKGPVLKPVRNHEDLLGLDDKNFYRILNPIAETIALTRQALSAEGFDHTALIGFSGSPWTMACYMIEGGASKEFAHIKQFAYADPEGFKALIDRLTRGAIDYLALQIEAGVEAIQLFESWASVPNADLFDRAIIQPTHTIVKAIKTRYPHIPVVGFPRLAGPLTLDYATRTEIDVLALDPQWSPQYMRRDFSNIPCLQGNLDPALLRQGGDGMISAIERLCAEMEGRAYVFNLGHGVIKETDPDHVATLVRAVRKQ